MLLENSCPQESYMNSWVTIVITERGNSSWHMVLQVHFGQEYLWCCHLS